MKRVLVFCVLLSLVLSLDVPGVWAIDVGWMQKGVRVWYMGAVGTGGTSDAEEAFLITSISGNTAQLTHNSGINHWTSPTAVPETGSILGEGPFWIHPQVLQNIAVGDSWRGIKIYTMNRGTYTYNTFKNTSELSSLPYLLLPIKALFDLKPQRELVRLVYGNPNYPNFDPVCGTAYFDAETGLRLFVTQMAEYVTTFFILSEINYNFATQTAFAEDNGPHTEFMSTVLKTKSALYASHFVQMLSSVESRYGGTVQMWTTTQAGGAINAYFGRNENYGFFGSVPVLRHINQTIPPTPDYPPENWNQYGEYLWWWVPTDALQKSTINVFGVDMTRTSTAPYTFTATEAGTGLYFSKLIFDNDGYMTDFSAKDASIGLDLDLGTLVDEDTTVDGLAYYKNTMGIATPVPVVYADFAGYGLYSWNGATWTLLNAGHPAGMVASGSSLYAYLPPSGLSSWNGSSWTVLSSVQPTSMVASGSTLYASFPTYGLNSWNGTSWTLLSGVQPTSMVASGSTLYVSFPGYGLYSWNGAWTAISYVEATIMVASGSTLYVSFPGYGLYSWNGSSWTLLSYVEATSMAASGSTLYAYFPSYGLYSWNGAWTAISYVQPTTMVASGSTLYAGFATYGLFSWNGASWTSLSTIQPANGMVASGSTVYAYFPSYGLYSWNGASWTLLSSVQPASMVMD